MNKTATLALLQLLLTASAAVSGNQTVLTAAPGDETVITAATGDVVILPCSAESGARLSGTRWTKDGQELELDPGAPGNTSEGGPRLAALHDGSLQIRSVVLEDRGDYACNYTLPGNAHFQSRVLLQVTNVPNTHPDCMFVASPDPWRVLLSCSWPGAAPPPLLRWGGGDGGDDGVFQEADSLSWTGNGSLLADGTTLKCSARPQPPGAGGERSCSLTLRRPYPEGQPLATALEASSVTLSCSEATSSPPANTSWRRGLGQEPVAPGGRYGLVQEGSQLRLTIVNVSKEDEGVYFCRSENPLGARVLEVYLSVKASSAYTGATIGVFVAALIVGSAIIVAKALYSIRHKICLGGDFGQMEDDREVLSLVDSDEDQIFRDAPPRLPPPAPPRPPHHAGPDPPDAIQ
ncbi:V-set and immunoglobulin domain-containing protein 10 isoform 3-T3 [Menidia menidia]